MGEMDFFKVMGFGAPAPEVTTGAPPWWLSSRPPGPSSPRTTPSSSSWARAGSGQFVVFAAVTAASFAPLARGKSVQETFLKNGKPEEFGPFNADAEMLNGR